jgi:hypothetical protein
MSAMVSARRADMRWWTKEHESDRAQCIAQVATSIWKDQTMVRQEMLRAARLYGSIPLLGLSPRLYRRRNVSTRRSKLALNVVKSVSDTYVAMLTDDKPKVTYTTNGGNHDLQQRAMLLTQFTDGIFFDTDVHDTAGQLALDCALFGVGVLKPIIQWNGRDEEPENDVKAEEAAEAESEEEKENDSVREQPRIAFDRVQPWRILIDETEAYSGNPKTLYEITYIDRLALMEEYPKHADKIQSSQLRDFDEWGSESGTFTDTITDDIAVIEAWHLPRTGRSGDGRHTIICGGVILFDEEFDQRDFPHEFLYRLRPAFGGVWGDALAAELEGIQLEINVLLQKIQRSHHLLAAGHWLVENGSDIVTGQLDNQIGSVVRYRGVPPQLLTVQAVAPDVYQQLDRLYERAFEIVGISQQVAQGQKPAGLNSGKAMLVYADVVSKRFQPSYRLFQTFFVKLARKVITLARQISDRFPEYAIKAVGPEMMQTIKWADANLEDHEFVVRPFATNELADEPAARMEIVQGLANAGYVFDKTDVLRLLDMPDLKSYMADVDSPYNWVMNLVDDILKEGDEGYQAPEPYMSREQLIDAIVRVQRAYFRAKREKVGEDKLALLRSWMNQAAEMVNTPGALKIPSPPPPPPPPGAGPPPGAPPPGMAPPMAA